MRRSRPDWSDPALERRWRALAARVGAPFFQDWTWVGCLAAERYGDPVLIEARRAGETVGLALFNRRRDWPFGRSDWLHESGCAAWDAVFVEHNGVLAVDDAVRDALLGAVPGGVARRLVLSGVDDAMLAAARRRGVVTVRATRIAPFVALDRRAGAFLDGLSRNTRHQLRRSERSYAARGALELRRAASLDEALGFLDALSRLHGATWRGRGKPGAFASPEATRFFGALLAGGVGRDEVDLLRLRAGSSVIGYLFNFRLRGVVSAYQSGLDYAGAGQHEKPGLTCHHLAIEAARAAGLRRYDFLAGRSQYKSSLADADATLHWLESRGRMHPAGLRDAARRVLGRMRATSS